MADLKILRGKENNLPTTKEDGTIYFCTDSKNLFIDYENDDGEIERAHINSDILYSTQDKNLSYPNNADDKGDTYQPLFIEDGQFKVCDDFAGGTLVHLNEEYKEATTASFYAPEKVGNIGQVLLSQYTNTDSPEPGWADQTVLNVGSALKLTNGATIGLSTGATGTATKFDGSSNIQIPVTDIKESYITWGGKNLVQTISPIDAACSNLHSANRFQFAKPDGIYIEYSTNGSTYVNYEASNEDKINLMNGNGASFYIGKRYGNNQNSKNDKLRITLTASTMSVYTRLRKLLLNITTNNAKDCHVTVETSTIGATNTFTTVGDYPLSGWSGWNSIPLDIAFGGSASQTSQIAKIRLTFGVGTIQPNYNNALTLLDIYAIGETYWNAPSQMAKTGHLYEYDYNQNMILPANLKITKSLYFDNEDKNVNAYMGPCTQSTDNTLLVGSIEGTTYDKGLAIGGSSKNLLWKTKVVPVLSDANLSGNDTTPVYVNNKAFYKCKQYAGGTKITFNGADKGASTASFYAPTASGTAGQVLLSGGTKAPEWTTFSANRVLISNGSGLMAASDITTTELNSLDNISGNVQTQLNNKLNKLTYEWNKEYNAGGTAGYLLIGSFPMYDTNLTINIDSTTTTTYHGTVVIATQNVDTNSIGSAREIMVYDDPSGTISDSIRVTWASGSRNYNVYFVPSTWSKNLIHIRAIGNYLNDIDETKICSVFTTGTAPSTTSGLVVKNALRDKLALRAHTHDYTTVTLNGKSEAGRSTSFYAPVNAAASTGQVVAWNNGTPSWVDQAAVITAYYVKAALGTGSGTTKYLREDGTWVKPPDAVSSVNGKTGAVTLNTKDVGVTLNGASNATTASFYAPTSAGTTSQILMGGGSAPSWKSAKEWFTNSGIGLSDLGILSVCTVECKFENGICRWPPVGGIVGPNGQIQFPDGTTPLIKANSAVIAQRAVGAHANNDAPNPNLVGEPMPFMTVCNSNGGYMLIYAEEPFTATINMNLLIVNRGS